MNIEMTFLAREQIKKFARDNCMTKEEHYLMSNLVSMIKVID